MGFPSPLTPATNCFLSGREFSNTVYWVWQEEEDLLWIRKDRRVVAKPELLFPAVDFSCFCGALSVDSVDLVVESEMLMLLTRLLDPRTYLNLTQA